ncbi:MAG: hypothetical protein ACRCX4_04410 [Bacteroidales bacterium]
MKQLKASVIIAFMLIVNMSANAQGFAFFQVENAITKALIKNQGDKPGVIEIVVDGNTDIKNVPMKYKLLSGCKISEQTPLTSDFSKPQTIIVDKGGISKEWTIAVHQLKSENAPVSITFGKGSACSIASEPEWAGYGIDYTKNTVVRFGNDGNMFFAAIPENAKEVSYNLTVVGGKALEGIFDVETSEDGKKWKRQISYTSGNPIKNNEEVSMKLPSNAKYIRWVYATREAKQNVNLNNITIK